MERTQAPRGDTQAFTAPERPTEMQSQLHTPARFVSTTQQSVRPVPLDEPNFAG